MNASVPRSSWQRPEYAYTCPILMRSTRHEQGQECLGLDCAWFVESKQLCAVACIRMDLEFIRLQVEDCGV